MCCKSVEKVQGYNERVFKEYRKNPRKVLIKSTHEINKSLFRLSGVRQG